MAMTGPDGEVYFDHPPSESGDEKLARAGIVKVSCEEAVGMTAEEFHAAVMAMRSEGRGKKSKTERLVGAATVVRGLAMGAEAHRRNVRRKLGLDK